MAFGAKYTVLQLYVVCLLFMSSRENNCRDGLPSKRGSSESERDSASWIPWSYVVTVVVTAVTVLFLVMVYVHVCGYSLKRADTHHHPQQAASKDREIGQITLGEQVSDNVWCGELKDGRIVAVKKYYKASNISKFRKELSILLRLSKTSPNPHVVQYICTEEKDGNVYVALERCDMNLEDAIKKLNDREIVLDMESCLHQITEGLIHIHKNKIQHRDIKPKNILLKKEESWVLKISDFDLGYIEKKSSSHKAPCGTKGWAAPELWNRGERTKAVDVFSLGCVFYYILTRGFHPFGSVANLEQCQQNIISRSFQAPKLKRLGSGQTESIAKARDVIILMIQHNHVTRPKVEWVLRHPFFWSEQKIREFYHRIGKMVVEKKDREFQKLLKANSSRVFTGSWTTRLDQVVLDTIEMRLGHKQKDHQNICKLLRCIRNKAEHFEELDEQLKQAFHSCPEGVARYFNEKFRNLLLYTFHTKEQYETQRRQASTSHKTVHT